MLFMYVEDLFSDFEEYIQMHFLTLDTPMVLEFGIRSPPNIAIKWHAGNFNLPGHSIVHHSSFHPSEIQNLCFSSSYFQFLNLHSLSCFFS